MVDLRTETLCEIELPEGLKKLKEISYNLWWTWNIKARNLFAFIDAGLWEHYRNPIEILINMEMSSWKVLMENDMFMTLYNNVLRDYENYMSEEKWFQKEYKDYKGGEICYLSTEYGFSENLHIYAGGLGILSGDHCKTASDLGLPFLGLGLLYKTGYFDQIVDPDGSQHNFYPFYDFSRLPIRPVKDEDGKDFIIQVPFPGRLVHAKIWKVEIGKVSVLLMDTYIPQNDIADRPITCQLYVRGREMRFCQEYLLGVGAIELVRKLGLKTEVWHMNEGHSAFLTFPLIAGAMKNKNLDFSKAINEVKKKIVFTTHTPVPAGNETFSKNLIKKYFKDTVEDLKISCDDLFKLGCLSDAPDEPFNMTALALKLSRYHNGVSKLHGEVSNEMWNGAAGKEIDYITNGVHIKTWVGPEMTNLFEYKLDKRWYDYINDPQFRKKIYDINDEEFFNAHQAQKNRLIRFVRKSIINQSARQGADPDTLKKIKKFLNENALLIGFARRFATYKRADLIFRDLNRIKNIMENVGRPVQFVFAGKAHPADKDGQELIKKIVNYALYSEVKKNVFFIENYNMMVGRRLVQGVDVWLNNPIKPREASGTSGQKASINGVLNLSVLDGWWPEAYNGKNGWAIVDPKTQEGGSDDGQDAQNLYRLLEDEVVPDYYNRNDKGIPEKWVAMMKESIITTIHDFSAARMVKDYTKKAYI